MVGAGEPSAGIVLAAGRGRRLAPITDHLAKPVVPYFGRPLVTYALDALRRAGVRRIGVNSFHHAEQVAVAVEQWRVAQGDRDLEVVVLREQQLMGTGGGARGVWEALGRPAGAVPVINGDIVTDVDLLPHLARHHASGAAATLLVVQAGEGRVRLEAGTDRVVGLPGPSGPVDVGPGDREVSFTGASILEAEAFAELPFVPGCLLRNGLVTRLLGAGRLVASASVHRHRDVGTPGRYWRAVREDLAADGEGTRADGVSLRPPLWIHPDAVVEPGCDIGPWVVLGPGARVASGSRVHDAVVEDADVQGHLSRRIRIGPAEVAIPP